MSIGKKERGERIHTKSAIALSVKKDKVRSHPHPLSIAINKKSNSALVRNSVFRLELP
ncbi:MULTISPECIES: hypothetical protein [unclassified Microcoleus]|uniref:hypothetical protein n=1 Tax=unclassified Microcoleus TaxID=2642155 RepID=UPI001D9641A8|nr:MULTISPECIES: hypothetical protein [unclassified Microcoleus]MCC3513441.1 hypothetical protein [Microcoleus sp. PH2017_17_BER_D_A]MCC3519064.1 hypothetical protein [Microcoleus sp. PH2017_18_LLB_O_A]MCC3550434.1 hypothetical protein [Microcoleus sp. PH2017_24_DOB_U_A]MCC3569780.1 hypothetical protein [Microcoleus sp. PH2017_31_RDM_U_A]MCC3588292.1 hypothetical protein [Microcoleus sp. PH2017_30_WIL_O_A]MCC3619985.1 hypothetical protein [Microcoleus sp. PH2017_38_RDM_U_B]